MCGTLLQKQGDEWVVISYHSKRLPKSAKNFGIIELELTGLLVNIHCFMQLLCNRYFEVLVDHKAIEYMIKSKTESPTTRLKTLLLKLSEYTIDFVNTTTDLDEDVSILEEDNSQIYAYLNNVLVHMIDKQQTAIFKSNQDFNKNKEKISQYIKYAENWQVASVICSYTAMACDVTYCSNDCFSVEISENYASNARSIFAV